MMRYVAEAVENQRQVVDAFVSELTVLPDRRDALLAPDASLVDLVEAVRELPYGRPRERSIAGLLRERRGTCSTKHLFLARALFERFPETKPQIVHRVYRAEPEQIRQLYGDGVAAVIPEEGVVDVHRYLRIQLGGRRVTLDATFPGGKRWDGWSSLPVACGPGEDIDAGDDPDADKRALEDRYCDPAVREPFIAALSASRTGAVAQPSATCGERHDSRAIACSLQPDDLRERQTRWQALLARAVGTTLRTGRGLRLTFRADAGVAEELEALVDLERQCCAFAKWFVHDRNEEIMVDVSGASEEAIAAAHAMFGDHEYRSVLKR